MRICIQQASQDYFSALRAIELAAFNTLLAANAIVGTPEASSDEELQRYLDAKFLYAAFDEGGVPVGYGGGYVSDGWLHIGEVDVHPLWQRRAIGRRLMKTLIGGGRARNLKGATLTTDRFAPFNAPFYASMGFYLLEGTACPERLRVILASEETKGLNPLRRVAMGLPFQNTQKACVVT